MGKRYSEILAEIILGIRYEDLPRGVIHQAKRCLLDFLGVALAGSKAGLAPLVTDIISGWCSKGEASVIGNTGKLSPMDAALLNGVSGHVLDMDDGHRFANAHPAVAIIPAAIAVAESRNASGKELIESIVAGYETFLRIGRAINPSHLKRGFHTTGTVGPFGAAAAASKLLQLAESESENALAIAGLQGAGLLEVTTSGQMAKPLHPGRAGQAGVLAAYLGQRGAEGPKLILEGEKGFIRALADCWESADLSTEAGNDFEIMKVYFKLYAACRHIHSALDATRKIMAQEGGLSVRDIKKIDVRTYSVAYRLTGKNESGVTELAAKFSIPLSIGLMLSFGKAGVDEYSRECVTNPLVGELAGKVAVTVDAAMDGEYPDKRVCRVEIETSRRAYVEQVDLAKGDPENPCSDEELSEKFLQNAAKVLPGNQTHTIQDKIYDIENISARDLTKYLRV